MRVEIALDFGRRGERHRRHHHRIALLDADGIEREVERRGAGVDGDGVRVPQEARELLLELLDPRPRRQPATLERGDDLVDLLRTEAGFVEGDVHRKSRNSTEQPSRNGAKQKRSEKPAGFTQRVGSQRQFFRSNPLRSNSASLRLRCSTAESKFNG